MKKNEVRVRAPFDTTRRKTFILHGTAMPTAHAADLVSITQDRFIGICNELGLTFVPNPPGRSYRGLLEIADFPAVLSRLGWPERRVQEATEYLQGSVRYHTRGRGRPRLEEKRARDEEEDSSSGVPIVSPAMPKKRPSPLREVPVTPEVVFPSPIAPLLVEQPRFQRRSAWMDTEHYHRTVTAPPPPVPVHVAPETLEMAVVKALEARVDALFEQAMRLFIERQVPSK